MEKPVKTKYSSKEVTLPESFLREPPADAQPITFIPIDFTQTCLPEYKGCYAVVLDNVLSSSECAELIRLAESSVEEADYRNGTDPWDLARVNVGGGYEVYSPTYRNSDRIIWDNQDIVDRIWARMEVVPGVLDRLAEFNETSIAGVAKRNAKPGMNWKFHRVNKRLRFLKYGAGQFFRPHCDGPYGENGPNGEVYRTWFTVHLYLNNSVAEVGEGAELRGGATSFMSSDEQRVLDVDPKAGRVLIFQHHRLYHSGADVMVGTKFTVRTDILYELQRPKKEDTA